MPEGDFHVSPKHEKWLLWGGAAASVVGLFVLFRRGGSTISTSPPGSGRPGGGSVGGGGGDLGSARLALEGEIARENLDLKKQELYATTSLGFEKLATDRQIAEINAGSKKDSSLISAGSSALRDLFGLLKGSQSVRDATGKKTGSRFEGPSGYSAPFDPPNATYPSSAWDTLLKDPAYFSDPGLANWFTGDDTAPEGVVDTSTSFGSPAGSVLSGFEAD